MTRYSVLSAEIAPYFLVLVRRDFLSQWVTGRSRFSRVVRCGTDGKSTPSWRSVGWCSFGSPRSSRSHSSRAAVVVYGFGGVCNPGGFCNVPLLRRG